MAEHTELEVSGNEDLLEVMGEEYSPLPLEQRGYMNRTRTLYFERVVHIRAIVQPGITDAATGYGPD